jgi:hypothetical protein
VLDSSNRLWYNTLGRLLGMDLDKQAQNRTELAVLARTQMEAADSEKKL